VLVSRIDIAREQSCSSYSNYSTCLLDMLATNDPADDTPDYTTTMQQLRRPTRPTGLGKDALGFVLDRFSTGMIREWGLREFISEI
jgi:hypothetical protein